MFPKKVRENIQYVHGNIIIKKLQVKVSHVLKFCKLSAAVLPIHIQKSELLQADYRLQRSSLCRNGKTGHICFF